MEEIHEEEEEEEEEEEGQKNVLYGIILMMTFNPCLSTHRLLALNQLLLEEDQ